jgi:hypothetical protein
VASTLHGGFAYAKQIGAKGVMVVQQADLNFNNEQHLADSRSGDACGGRSPPARLTVPPVRRGAHSRSSKP